MATTSGPRETTNDSPRDLWISFSYNLLILARYTCSRLYAPSFNKFTAYYSDIIIKIIINLTRCLVLLITNPNVFFFRTGITIREESWPKWTVSGWCTSSSTFLKTSSRSTAPAHEMRETTIIILQNNLTSCHTYTHYAMYNTNM